MKVQVIGGFLGAGKTTAMLALARHLEQRGERVSLVTNDQGHDLVDTVSCRRNGHSVLEIGGGCFCCRYEELERALLAAADAGATTAIAEAVGSCADLVTTVLAPLAERHPGRLRIAPLSVVVDPWRVEEMAAGGFPEDVRALFEWQIAEADVVVLTRADLQPPDVTEAIFSIHRGVPIVRVSGRTGEGIGAWLAERPASAPSRLEIDYARYAAAEGLLGWCNGRVRVRSNDGFSPFVVLGRFLHAVTDSPVAHVKLTGVEPGMGGGTLVRHGDTPRIETRDLPARATDIAWIVNARIALPPEQVETLLRQAMAHAARPAEAVWEQMSSFRPAPPSPVHRRSPGGTSGSEASCCAAFYARPDVRYLLGESLHPGGVALTLEMAAGLGLDKGGRVLDVACGDGTSLRAVIEAFPTSAVGLDVSTRDMRQERLELRRGDAHAIPADDASFDAVLCECALSTFADQAMALQEMRRVLRPGGRLALSDMVVEGPIPQALQPWVNAGTCLAHAHSSKEYERLLRQAGFVVVVSWDATECLLDLLARVKRNLVGAALARAAGVLPSDVKFDVRRGRDLLREAEAAVKSGVLGYGVIIAQRVDR